ncbi:MAG: beta-galactosidase [Clostridia bacterium]|nr:beta-galactosidase [Clostridia bacterium]
MSNAMPRPEHPRPGLVREDWMNLNGTWEFEIDHGCTGRARGLAAAEGLSDKILVPFCPESSLSGQNYKDFMACVWYKRRVTLPEGWKAPGRRVLLHFGACDFETEVWINGISVGLHRGGYVSFSFDITDALTAGENTITVAAEDNLRSHNQPAGKQSDRFGSHGCFYTRTTGIWQTVWMESVPAGYIEGLKLTPDVANACLWIEATCRGAEGLRLAAEAKLGERVVGRAEASVSANSLRLALPLSEISLWDIGSPVLYGLSLTLGEDRAESYFGMRSLRWEGEKLILNGRPVFQRLVLDQGFYPDGIYTARSDAELEADILRSQAMGFNGARLHEKVFEERFLYHCDRLGYIVWGEHANWGLDVSRPEAWRAFLPEWLEILRRDYNHPAIVGWCPLNETQADVDPVFVRMLCAMTHAFDPDRAFIDGSGWTHVPGATDIMDCHDYEQDPAIFRAKYEPLARGEAVPIHRCREPKKPTFVSEYGGIWWSDTDDSGWGYGKRVQSREECVERFRGLTDALLDNPAIYGLCYTQLTDVEQEQNGLYTYDRRAKFDPAVIHAILTRPAAMEE